MNSNSGREIEIVVRVTMEELMTVGDREITGIKHKLVDSIVEKITEAMTPSILAKLDPQAVANLAIAESAKIIRTKFIDPAPEPKK